MAVPARERPLRAAPTSERLRQAAALVRADLRSCTLCPWECRVDRHAGERGYCGLGAEGRVFHHYLSFSEEPEISPTYEILFSGCSHRCRFCSVLPHVVDPGAGRAHPPEDIAAGLRAAARQGARTMSFVGGEPTVNMLAALELLEVVASPLPVVWNSNMFMGDVAHEALEGVVDTFVGDVHFGNDACALRVGGVAPYVDRIFASFERASRHARVIVRHLLLPGHVECCFVPVAAWAAERMAGSPFHLMRGYMPPRELQGALGAFLPPDAWRRAQDEAERMGLVTMSC